MAEQQTAEHLYKEAIVFDGLNVSNWESANVYESLHRGSVAGINATMAVHEGFVETMDNVVSWLRRFEERSSTLLQATTVRDILDAKEEGRTGVVLGWQNAGPIERDLNRLELFYELGVRIIQVTYNERNLLGSGCWEPTDEGLSAFGRDAVAEMNRLGILIDLSHVGDRTTMETIELSESPVACTHANARSFVDNPRNKTDDAIRLIADKGGVIGATAWPPFLPHAFDSTLDDFVDAIDYLVEMLGVDHVGFGTDYTQDQSKEWFDWLMSWHGTKPVPERRNEYPDTVTHPVGIETPDRLSNVVASLVSRGYMSEDVLKIMGGNWLRLLRDVWGE